MRKLRDSLKDIVIAYGQSSVIFGCGHSKEPESYDVVTDKILDLVLDEIANLQQEVDCLTLTVEELSGYTMLPFREER